MDTGKIITLLRTAEGLSQAELADELKVSRATLSQVENGRIQPSLPFLRKIAEYFKIPLPVLLADENEPESEFMVQLKQILADSLVTRLSLSKYRQPKQKSKKKTKIKA